MIYAKRMLSILLILCVLSNMAITVFASDTDSGGEVSVPVDTATDEPATESPPPEQGEDPPPEVLTDEGTEPSPEGTAPLENNEGAAENPTEAEETSPSPGTVEEATSPENSVVAEESVEESTEPVSEDAPAEEPAEESSESVSEDASAENSEEAEKTEVGKRAETRASGLSVTHCGNEITTSGTFSFTYYSYLEGATKSTSMNVMEEKRINGAVAYCIQPEVTSQGTNYSEAEQKDAWNKLPAYLREAITLTMAYGYPHVSYSASADDTYWYGKQAMLDGENYIATQLIIWEFLAGVRNSITFELTGSTSFRNTFSSGWATIRTTYDAIVKKLENHNVIPAYASGIDGDYVYELKYDSSTGTYRYMLPTDRQSDWRNCRIELPDGITYLKKSDGMTVIGFEATVEAAMALPTDGYRASGETPSVSVDPDQAVACWTCDGSQAVATMALQPDPARAYFTLKLAAIGDMSGKKTSPTGDVEGYCFQIYNSETDSTWYAKTDASGNLCVSDSSYSTLGSKSFEDSPQGTYTLVEVLSKKGKDVVFPDKWVISVTNVDGTVNTTTYTADDMTRASNGDCRLENVKIAGLEGGGTITMTINNVPQTADLQIIKTSPNGNISGIEFYVKDSSGKEVGRGTTDANGKLVFKDLTIGQTYTVTEVVKSGWICENNNQQITIKTGTNTLTFVNKRLDLKVIKQSSDGNVSGISFQVFAGEANYSNGTVWKTVTTGSDGSFTIEGIPAGDYWVREIVPDGYAVQADQKVTVTDANTSDNPAVVTFANKRLDLKIIKQSSDGNVSGISFQVFAGETNYNSGTVWKTATTGSDGSFTIEGIPAGDYWVREIVPQGYAAQADQKVTVTDKNTSDNPAIVTFTNKQLVCLKIVKESPDGNVAGITFKIYKGFYNSNVDDSYLPLYATVKTDSDGTILLADLEPDTYYVKEVVPEGYMPQSVQSVTVTIESTVSDPAIVTFVNEPRPILKIIKESPDGNIAGISFNIYAGSRNYNTGNILQTVTTTEDGTILLVGLNTTTQYYIEEVVPQGYAPQKVRTVRLTSNNTPVNPAIVTFTNKPLALKIVKQSSDGNISGISFQIFAGETDYNNGTIFSTVTTGEDGTIQINAIEAGDYWVREIVPEGYLPQADQKITVKTTNTMDKPATVTFVNQLLRGTISVNKVSTSNVSLAGATFLLEYSTDNGATWSSVKPATEEENGIGTCSTVAEDGTLTTGEDGLAVFDELIVYGVSYRVTETKAPEGFQLLAEPVFTGEIEADNDGNYEICRTVVNMPILLMPPAGGDGSVRLLGALSMTVAAVSLLVLGLMLKRRKSETEG